MNPKQKPGDYVRGTEKAKTGGKEHPFKDRLVGCQESIGDDQELVKVLKAHGYRFSDTHDIDWFSERPDGDVIKVDSYINVDNPEKIVYVKTRTRHPGYAHWSKSPKWSGAGPGSYGSDAKSLEVYLNKLKKSRINRFNHTSRGGLPTSHDEEGRYSDLMAEYIEFSKKIDEEDFGTEKKREQTRGRPGPKKGDGFKPTNPKAPKKDGSRTDHDKGYSWETLDEATSADKKLVSLLKKEEALSNRLGLARERRRATGKSKGIQGPAEMRIAAQLEQVRREIHAIKYAAPVTESMAGEKLLSATVEIVRSYIDKGATEIEATILAHEVSELTGKPFSPISLTELVKEYPEQLKDIESINDSGKVKFKSRLAVKNPAAKPESGSGQGGQAGGGGDNTVSSMAARAASRNRGISEGIGEKNLNELPDVGDSIITKMGGQIPGQVTDIEDGPYGIQILFKHESGKVYRTPLRNVIVVSKGVREGIMDYIPGTKANAARKTEKRQADLAKIADREAAKKAERKYADFFHELLVRDRAGAIYPEGAIRQMANAPSDPTERARWFRGLNSALSLIQSNGWNIEKGVGTHLPLWNHGAPRSLKHFYQMAQQEKANGGAVEETTIQPQQPQKPGQPMVQQQQATPQQQQAAAAGLASLKSTTGSTATPQQIAQSLEKASAGSAMTPTDTKNMSSIMQGVAGIAKDPTLANQFGQLAKKAGTTQ